MPKRRAARSAGRLQGNGGPRARAQGLSGGVFLNEKHSQLRFLEILEASPLNDAQPHQVMEELLNLADAVESPSITTNRTARSCCAACIPGLSRCTRP